LEHEFHNIKTLLNDHISLMKFLLHGVSINKCPADAPPLCLSLPWAMTGLVTSLLP